MGDLVFGACELAYSPVHFDDLGPAPSKLRERCLSRLRVESLYLCIKTYAPADAVGWIEPLTAQNETCQRYLNESMPPFDIVAHYSDEDVVKLRHLAVEERAAALVYSELLVPSEDLYQHAYDTLDATDLVYYYHYAYGAAVVVFWVGVAIVGLISRLIWAIAYTQRYGSYSSRPPGLVSRFAIWLKRYVTIPATFGYRCAQNMGWCTVPPRVQSLTILVFIILNTFFCAHGYRFFEGNLYYESVETQVWRYISDRTGIISFANFPIIWLFGMRNNLVTYITGWDFAAFNNFHRWVARVATLQAVIHSIGYTVLIVIEGGWTYYWSWWVQLFWCAGILATVFMCFILGFSVYWMRRKQYELFLILHIGLSILMLVTMILHVSIFKTRYDLLGWVPAAIWALDRVFRMGRTVSFNLRFWDTWASATYDPSSNMVRLVVPHTTSFYQPEPGSFYYLHVLSDRRFWESHPFTMAYSTGHRRRPSKDSTEDTPLMQEDDAISLAHDAGETPSMTFLVRPYDGFTGRLKDAAASSWPAPAPLRVLVEGPYGHTQPFDAFENVLFVVGGSGIAVPLAYLSALVSSGRTRTVRIVWAVREVAFAEDVLTRDVGVLADSTKVSLRVFVTHRDLPGGDVLRRSFPDAASVAHHRPDVSGEVAEAVRSAGKQSLAVVACGPARMADDARRAVVEAQADATPRIEYFEESFTW
ncbi:ferric-chelate reductase [Plectosphaerella plurivora]|uniref:Ferric-chelate reductase n=1 Tax=Plectosphaerella plurivora TaxID=936078 RepID=A0A9P9A5A0_9PEZI|nr:ferric-chelate reductase [Plectosphaerella plurivora]